MSQVAIYSVTKYCTDYDAKCGTAVSHPTLINTTLLHQILCTINVCLMLLKNTNITHIAYFIYYIPHYQGLFYPHKCPAVQISNHMSIFMCYDVLYIPTQVYLLVQHLQTQTNHTACIHDQKLSKSYKNITKYCVIWN